MPILSFLSRNKKQRSHDVDDSDSNSHSPTAEYIIPSKYVPSSPNGNPSVPDTLYSAQAPSSSKLRLPFRRGRSDLSTSETFPTHSFYASRTSTGSDLSNADQRSNRSPPPSKSAIFAASYPQGALSTRSLPNESAPQYPSFSSAVSDPPTPQPPKLVKSQGGNSFFPWSKSFQKPRTKPKDIANVKVDALPLRAPVPRDPDNSSASSFNLKSFRHIRAPSPPIPPSDPPLPVPSPRPRGGSKASEVNPRISVAAFREVQSRRSTAELPVPSIKERESRNNSPVDVPQANSSTPSRSAPDLYSRSPNSSLRPDLAGARRSTASPAPRLSAATVSTFRGSGSGYVETTEDEDEENESSDTDDVPVSRGNGNGRDRLTIITKTKAKSEAGHGLSATPRSTTLPALALPGARALSSYIPGALAPMVESPQRSKSSLGVYSAGGRLRASVSTSALVPSDNSEMATGRGESIFIPFLWCFF